MGSTVNEVNNRARAGRTEHKVAIQLDMILRTSAALDGCVSLGAPRQAFKSRNQLPWTE